MRQLRRELSAEELARASEATCGHLIEYLSAQNGNRVSVIATYAAVDGEIDLCDFGAWAQAQGKTLAFPILRARADISADPAEPAEPAEPRAAEYAMSLRTWDPAAGFEAGPFEIPEPIGGDEIGFADCQLVLTPGVAFTAAGARLGRGKGYYDQALSFLSGAPRPAATQAIGICHGFQVLNRLPTTDRDIPMDALAGPFGLERCEPNQT